MLKRITVLAVTLCLTSCATIFTTKEYDLMVESKTNNSKAVINDSIYTLPASVMVKRSKEDLKVTLIADTLKKDFTVKPILAPTFLFGNLVMPMGIGGYAVDLTNQKRFYYGRKIVLDMETTDTIIKPSIFGGWKDYFSKKYTPKKGPWAFTVSIPYANQFYQQPRYEGNKSQFGFFGLSAGLEYYYKDNRFVKINASAPIDFEFPIPVPLDRFDSYETMRSFSFTVTDNYKRNRFSFGYGLNYTIHIWEIVNPDWEFPSNDEQPRKKNTHSFGLTGNTYFQLSENWSAGLVYNPTFFNSFPESGFCYQHTISFDLMYRLPFGF